MSNKIDSISSIQRRQYKEIAEAILQARLKRASWLQRLILKKVAQPKDL